MSVCVLVGVVDLNKLNTTVLVFLCMTSHALGLCNLFTVLLHSKGELRNEEAGGVGEEILKEEILKVKDQQ